MTQRRKMVVLVEETDEQVEARREEKVQEKRQWGRHLQALRLKAGFSQGTLAATTGLSAAAIKQWEQGKREPLREGLVALADALRVSLDTLCRVPDSLDNN